MLTREKTEFDQRLADDAWWEDVLSTRDGIAAARDWLGGQLGDLRAQRRQKSSRPKREYDEFLARQAGYERLIRKRWDQTVAAQRSMSTEEETASRLRKWNKDLRDGLRRLATVVDDYMAEEVEEDALEDALDDITVSAKGRDWSLREALADLPRFRWEEGSDAAAGNVGEDGPA